MVNSKNRKLSITDRLADYFARLFKKKPDLIFRIIRNIKPNLSLPGKGGFVIVARFHDVREALERPEIFNVVYAPMMDPSVGPFMLGRDNTTINQRDKGIMRALMQREDLPRVRELVSRLTKDAIRPHLSEGKIDVVKHISRHVPIRLTGEYFGFAGPDIESMLRWSFTTQHDMFHNFPGADKKVHEANVRSGNEMRSYLEGQIPLHRAGLENAPLRDEILSRLLKVQTPVEIGFDEARIATNIMGTLVGGIETTSQAIAQILQQLFKRPDILKDAVGAARAGNDDLVASYCWEALRFDPINPFMFRRCVEDYKIASGTFRRLKIKAGKTVLISTRSAMRDGRELPNASEFRIDRPKYHYMHFGYALHSCLGDQVSSVQIPEIIKQLLLLPGVTELKPITNLGSTQLEQGEESPFPESYTLGFDKQSDYS